MPDAGQLKPIVYERVFKGLKSLPEGLKILQERGTWGKAVLQVDEGPQTKL
jgi:NADPH2:quinone reductase